MQRIDADCEENRDPGAGKINKDPSAIDNGEAIRERLRFGEDTLCKLSWSLQPYVRPVDAAHREAAAHNVGYCTFLFPARWLSCPWAM